MAVTTNNSGEDSTSPLTVATAGSLLDRLLLSDEEPEDKVEPQVEGETPETDPEVDPDTEPGDDADQDEPDAEDDDEEVAPAPRKIRVPKGGDNGEDIEVDETEAAAGYLRRSDYTRKTQAVAEEKKALAAEAAKDVAQRVAYAERLTQLDAVLKEQTPPEPDWQQLRKEMKPEDYNATWIAWQEHKEKLGKVTEAKRKADEAVFHDQKKAYEAHVTAEEAALLTAIPEWKDAGKRTAEMTKLVNFAVNTLGYDRKELALVTDHRVIKTVRDAFRYNEIIAKRKAATTQVERADKEVVAPKGGSSEKKPVSKTARANMRLAKTGSVNDAAAVLMSIPGLLD